MLDKVQFFKEELTNRKEINHEYQGNCKIFERKSIG